MSDEEPLILDDSVVAMLRLPASVKPLAKTITGIVNTYGDDVRMQQLGDYMVFRLPEVAATRHDTPAAHSGTTPR